jgi:hypothetical protein
MDIIIEFINLVKLFGSLLYFLYENIVGGFIHIVLFNEETDVVIKYKNNTIESIDNLFIDIGVNITWKMLEIVGTIKIFYNKSLIPLFHNTTNDYFRNTIILIKNGNEVMSIKNNEVFEALNIDKTEYDMILCSDYSLNDSKRNYTLITDNVSDIKKSKVLLSNKTNVSFIIFQLLQDGKKYDINLKEPKNFFIKNNTLRQPFFKWYMNKIYNIELSDDFSVNYMAQDMSVGNMHSPFFIKFNDASVTSFSSGKPKPKPTPIESNEEIISDTYDNEDTDLNMETFVEKNIVDIVNCERLKSHLE